ncbi:uncharacterized protein LOC122290983 [Carya illinoinensis]|uniref:uncharacterized protein LOC122290983 n=1 Tax=Carya illinoinensis TaxID=32201 RepID=UPI001C72285D|nr:uncharacterized protein LOC122290983 [Carya illinoinensis]
MLDNEFPNDDHPLLGDGDVDAIDEAYMVWLMWMTNENGGGRYPMPQHNIGLRGDQYIQGVLNGNPQNCIEMFHTEVTAFEYICQVLRETMIMGPTERTELEESLAIFCLIVGHGQGQRVVADRFQHSTEIINRHVKTVTRALHELGRSVIRLTHTVGVHPYIASNRHNYPWFQNCLGAMDGTMISVAALTRLGNAYRIRHSRIAQNVLCACDFDMKFTYVYTGWEGTTYDAQFCMDVLSRPDNQFTWPASGYYYLVDAAFPCIEMFMPPYPRERYHRSDRYNEGGFQGYKDYFNY